MKKFTKVCLIIAAVLLVFGTGITTLAAAMGGGVGRIPFFYAHNDWSWKNGFYDVRKDTFEARNEWNDAWDEAEDEWDEAWSKAELEWDDAWGEAESDWDEAWGEMGDEINGIPEELSEDLKSTFVLEEELKFAGVTNLDIDVSAGSVQIITTEPGDQIVVQIGEGDGSYQVNLKDDHTLKLDYKWKKKISEKTDRRQIQIMVPRDYQFDKVEADIGAGIFAADNLLANELELDIKAGIILVEEGDVQNLEMDCSAVDGRYNGIAEKEVSVDCSAGNISIHLNAKETDYDYELKSKAGTIKIGDSSYSALISEEKVRNQGSTGRMELDCSAGALEVSFEQE